MPKINNNIEKKLLACLTTAKTAYNKNIKLKSYILSEKFD